MSAGIQTQAVGTPPPVYSPCCAESCADAIIQPLLDFQDSGLLARIVAVFTMTLASLVLCLSVVGLPLFIVLCSSFVRLTEAKPAVLQAPPTPAAPPNPPELTEEQLKTQASFASLARKMQTETTARLTAEHDRGRELLQKQMAEASQQAQLAQQKLTQALTKADADKSAALQQTQLAQQKLDQAFTKAEAGKRDALQAAADAHAKEKATLQQQLAAANARPALAATAEQQRLVQAIGGLGAILSGPQGLLTTITPAPRTATAAVTLVQRLAADIEKLKANFEATVKSEHAAKAASATAADRAKNFEADLKRLQALYEAAQQELTTLRAEHNAHLRAQHQRAKSIEKASVAVNAGLAAVAAASPRSQTPQANGMLHPPLFLGPSDAAAAAQPIGKRLPTTPDQH